jgi:hypothetical protein
LLQTYGFSNYQLFLYLFVRLCSGVYTALQDGHSLMAHITSDDKEVTAAARFTNAVYDDMHFM